MRAQLPIRAWRASVATLRELVSRSDAAPRASLAGRHGRARRRRVQAAAGAVLAVAGALTMITSSPVAGASPPSPDPTWSLTESAPATLLYGNPASITLTATDNSASAGGMPQYNLSFEELLPPGVRYVAGSTSPSTIGDPNVVQESSTPSWLAATSPALPDASCASTTSELLIWSNVADLQPASTTAITFSVQPDTELTTGVSPPACPYPPVSRYTDSAAAFANSDPRYLAVDTSTGALGTVGGTVDAEAAGVQTSIEPIAVTVSDPLPEHELERGVHQQQTAYTVTVQNSDIYATALTSLDAYLPAGLEFLGCGGVDNTSSAVSAPGSGYPNAGNTTPGQSTFEYPGSGSIAAGNGGTLSSSGSPPCLTPTSVSTVSEPSPPAGLAAGSNEGNPIYTDVNWTFDPIEPGAPTDVTSCTSTSGSLPVPAGDLPYTCLAPGASFQLRYLAAVPLRENTTTWPAVDGAGGPAPASDLQAANLDNNSGASTLSLSSVGAAQTTGALAAGDYLAGLVGGASDPVSAEGSDTDTVHDIAIQKSITSSGLPGCNGGSFSDEQVVCVALHVETSEYRYSSSGSDAPNGVEIVDTLPNGTCPVLATPSSGSFDPQYANDCTTTNANVSGSDTPTLIYTRGGASTSVGYSGVVEDTGTSDPGAGFDGLSQNPPAGGFTVTFFVPGPLPTNSDGTLTFAAVDRPQYEQYSGGAFSAATPTVAGDSFADSTEVTSDTYAACVQSGDATLDPTCANGSSSAIDPADEPGGPGAAAVAQAENNPSAASQSSDQPVISKLIGLPTGSGSGLSCANSLDPVSYSASLATPLQDGDVVCFQLTVTFPSTIHTRNPVITDFLPPNATYDAAASGLGASTATRCTPQPPGAPSPGQPNPYDEGNSGDGDQVQLAIGMPVSGSCSGSGDLYAQPGDQLVYDLAATISGPPGAGNDFQLTQNLMKYTSENTAGQAIAERADATYTVSEPDVTIQKGIEQATLYTENGGSASGESSGTAVNYGFGADKNAANGLGGGAGYVRDGDSATMRLDLTNSGQVDARNVEVWDVLPFDTSATACADLAITPGQGGTCYDPGQAVPVVAGGGETATLADPVIAWSVADLPAAGAGTNTTTVDYTFTVPASAAAGDQLVDESGVVSYVGQPGTTGAADDVTYLPVVPSGSAAHTSGGFPVPSSGSISCPALSPPATSPGPSSSSDADLACLGTSFSGSVSGATEPGPTPRAGDYVDYPSFVQVLGAGLTKAASPSTATIGQEQTYTLTATFPAGTTIDSGSISDDLASSSAVSPTGALGYVDTTAQATCTENSATVVSLSGDSASSGGYSLAASTGSNTITLALPASVTVAPSGSALVCVVSFTATVQDIAGDHNGVHVTDKGTLSYGHDAGDPATGSPLSSNQTSTLLDEPTLHVQKTVRVQNNDNPAQPGDTLAYTITVTDTGTSTAYNLAVVDPLPANAEFDCAVSPSAQITGSGTPATVTLTTPSPCVGNPLGGTVSTNTIADLTTAQTLTITYTELVPNPPVGSDTYSNTAHATATSCSPAAVGITCDPGVAGGDGRTTYTGSATATVVSAYATIAKHASPSAVPVGAPVTYTDTITLPANTTFPDLDVVDVLPNGLAFASYANCSTGVHADGEGGSYVDSGTGLAVSCENETAASGSGSSSPTAGEHAIAWSFGDVAAAATSRQVALVYSAYPAKTYTVSSAHPSGGSVAAGNTLVNTVSGYWDETTGNSPPTSAPDPSSGTARFGFTYQTSPPATATITVLAPALSISKSSSPSSIEPGQATTWTVTITNSSAATSTTAYLDGVSDPLPSLLCAGTSCASSTSLATTETLNGSSTGTPVSAAALSGQGAGFSGGTLTWNLTGQAIPPGSSVTLRFQTILASSTSFLGSATSASIANTATATTYYAVCATVWNGGTPGLCNAGDSFGPGPSTYLSYGPSSGNGSVLPLFPALTVSKFADVGCSAPSGTTDVGKAATWCLQLSDTVAGTSVQAAVVTDTLPADWSYVAGSTSVTPAGNAPATLDPGLGTNGGRQTLTWGLVGTIAHGTTVTITYQATPSSAAAAHKTSNLNQVAVAANDLSGASGTGNGAYQASASANDSIPVAELQLSKTHTGLGASNAFVAGATGTYTLSVINAAGADPAAEPITVTDTLPAGLSYAASAGIGWSCDGTSPPLVSCTYGAAGSSLAGGSTLAQLSITVDVSASIPLTGAGNTGSVTNSATVTDNGTYDGPGSILTANDPTTIVGADLTIGKTHTGISPGNAFVAGQHGSYTLTVTDNGPADSTGTASQPITVTDTLPAGESYVSAGGSGWSCSGSGQALTCTYPSVIAAAASAPAIAVVVAVSPSALGTLTNQASVTAGVTPDPVPSNNTASDPTTIDTSADLSITKVLSSPAGGLVSGEDATYTLSVANAGPSDAVTPEVQDVLPAGESFVSATGSGWTCAAVSGTVTCTAAGNLAAGGSEQPITLTVAVASSAIASITNTAVTCSGSIGQGSNPCGSGLFDTGTPDPNLPNNSSSAPSLPSVGADLTISKSHTGNFAAGGTGVYTIVASNKGPADSVGPITVVDTLPQVETFVSGTGSGWTCAAGTGLSAAVVTCTDPATIVAGTALPPITLTVAVGNAAGDLGTVTNSAEVIPGSTGDPNPGNNTATDPTTIEGADLSIAKVAETSFVPGQQASYAITVSNAGPADSAPTVTVADTLPAGESFVSASGSGWTCSTSGGSGGSAVAVGCSDANLVPASGSAAPITLTVALDPGLTGNVVNTATVSPGPTTDPNPSNNSATATTPVAPEVAVSIDKTHGAVATLGGLQHYSLAVRNAGPSTDPGPTTVTDELPAGERYVAATGSGWQCAVTARHDSGARLRQRLRCTLAGTLPPGAAAPAIDLTVRLGVAAYPSVTNTATVSTPAPNPTPGGATSSSTLSPTPVSKLSLAKRLVGTLAAGGTATYQITVTNAGPSPARKVTASDDMPAGLSPLSGSGPGWSCVAVASANAVTCTRASLPVGSSTITVTAHVSATAGATIANAAQVEASPPRNGHGAVAHVLTPPAVVKPPAAPPASSTTTSTTTTTAPVTSNTVSPGLTGSQGGKRPAVHHHARSHHRAKPSAPGNGAKQLAFTGLELLPLAALAGGLALLGAALVSLGSERRRRRRAVG